MKKLRGLENQSVGSSISGIKDTFWTGALVTKRLSRVFFLASVTIILCTNFAFAVDASSIESVMRKYQNKYHYVAVVNNFSSKYLTWPQLHCTQPPSYPVGFYGEITDNEAETLVNNIVNKFYETSQYSYSNISGYFLEEPPEGEENWQTVIITYPNPQDSWQDRLAQVSSDIDKLVYYRVFVGTTEWLGKSGSGSSINCHWVPCTTSRDDIIENESFGDAKSEAEGNWNQSTSSSISGGITVHTSVSHSCDDYCDEWYDYTGYGKNWSASISSKNFKLEADLRKHTGSATCYVKAYKRDAEQPAGSPVVSVAIDNKYHSWQSASVGSEWTSGYLFADTPPVAEDPGSTTCSGTDSDYNSYSAGWAYSNAIVVVQPSFDSETDPVLSCSSPTELVYKTKDKHIAYSANEGCGHNSGETVKGRILVNGYDPDVSMKLEVKLNSEFSDKIASVVVGTHNLTSDDTQTIYCCTPDQDEPNDVWYVPFSVSAKINEDNISISIATVYSENLGDSASDPNEAGRIKTYRGEGESVKFQIKNNGYECCNRKETLNDGDKYPKLSKHENGDIEIFLPDIEEAYIMSPSFFDMSISGYTPEGAGPNEYIKLSGDGFNSLVYSIDSNWIADDTAATATFVYEIDSNGDVIESTEYDGNGRLDKICNAADPTNFYRQFHYDDGTNPYRITSYTDYAGQVSRTYTLVYDETSGRLAGTIGGTGSGCSSCALSASNRLYYYDDFGNVLTVTDIEGTVIHEYEYDTQNRLVNTWLGVKTDAVPVQEVVYDPNADAFGGVKIQDIYDYTSSSDARLTRNILGADGKVITKIAFNTLNLDGSAVTDPNTAIALGGHITTYEYAYSGSTLESISTKSPAFNDGAILSYFKNTLNNDSYGNEETILVTVDPNGVDPDTETPISRYSYSNNKLVSSADARQIQEYVYTSYSYDSNGHLSTQSGPSQKQLNGEYTNLYYSYTYYPDGRMKTETVSNSNQTSTRVTTTYFYNHLGHLAGTETRDYYDNLLSSTQIKSNGFGEQIYSIDNTGVAKGKEYDSHGKLISEFVFADSTDTTLFDGDDPNALLEDISGVYTNLEVVSQTRYVYNTLGQLQQVKVAVADDVFTYDVPNSWYITSYLYDDYGRKIQQTEDTTGLALITTYQYDNQGQLVKTIHPDGHWSKQIRNGRGLVTKTIDGHGPENTEPNDFIVSETVYDADGNVIKEIKAGDIINSYILDNMGGIWRAYQGDYETEYCDYIEYTRDLDGHILNQITVSVDSFGNETIIQEEGNRYNTRGELIEQRILEDPDTGKNDLLDKVTLFAYDHQGKQIESVTKADGNSSIYTNQYEDEVEYESGDKVEQNWYDLSGNLEYTFKFEYVGDSATYHDLPFDSIEDAFAYTKDSQEVYVSSNVYADGRLWIKEILNGFDEADPYFDNWSYPFAGVTWHPGATYEYDNAGRIAKTIDADDNFTELAYNSRNQQTEQTLWQGKPILRVNDGSYDPNTFDPYPLQRTLTAYDTAGRKSRTVVLADPNESVSMDEINLSWDKVTDFVYNANGKLYRQKELIEQDGVTFIYGLTELGYDGHGRVDEIEKGELEEYYLFGSLFSTTKTVLKTIGYQYNTKNQKTVQTITEVNTSDYTTANFSTWYDYDSQGRLDEIQNAQGIIYACEYDALGRKTEETDSVGMVTQYDYYTTGELYKKTENPTGLNRQTVYTYDRFGRQITIGSASDHTDYAYNYLDLITDVNYPTGDTLVFAYDMLGSVVSRTDTKDSVSIVTKYKRDALGRVSYKQYTGETDWTEPNSLLPFDEILYDAAGRKNIIAYMSDGNDLELNIYSYNGFGNLTSAGENNSDFSSSVTYGYDQRGLLKSITYPDERVVTYTRDALGRVDSVTYDGKHLVDYFYQGDIVVKKTIEDADIEYLATVDTLGRITGETFSDISTSTAFLTNSYDYTSYSDRMDERNTVDYTFDGLGKLTAEDSTSYTSDILGNPTNAADDGLIYMLDNENRVVDVDDVSGDVAEYAYDRLGRRAFKTVDGATTNFVYDLYGNVIAEYEGESWKRDYIYGAQGEAIYMRFPQTTEMNDALDNFFGFIDAWLCYPNCTTEQLIWDCDDSNDINLIDWAYAVDANDFDGAFTSNGRYLLTDFRNSVIGKVNLDGSVDEITYDAWGTPSTTQGADLEGLSILWNGYYLDDETGNYYLRNRYYSPLERCFLTEDPHGINPDGNWNNSFSVPWQYSDGYGLQVYALGDPINGTDAWGLERIKLHEINWNSGKLPLVLIWIKIELKGEVYLDIIEGMKPKECPTKKWPKNIRPSCGFKPHLSWNSLEKEASIDAYLGAVGDGFEAKYGIKYGISTSGDSLLKQLWNLSLDQGSYHVVNVEGQKYYENYNKHGVRKRCVCVRPGLDLNPKSEHGIYGVRVGMAVFLWKAALAAGAAELQTAGGILVGG